MYGDNGGKIPIKNMVDPITMVVERMREKNPDLVVIPGIIPLSIWYRACEEISFSMTANGYINHFQSFTMQKMYIFQRK